MSRAQLLRIAAGCLVLAAVLPARGEGGERGLRVPPLPAYQQECAACHVAYPPGMLPAASWRRLLAGLPTHFGSDASLDPKTVQALGAWLTAHAQPAGAAAPPEDRLTRGQAFQRAHHELDPAIWQRASIRKPSNCAACHPRADQGDFNEHAVRIPR